MTAEATRTGVNSGHPSFSFSGHATFHLTVATANRTRLVRLDGVQYSVPVGHAVKGGTRAVGTAVPGGAPLAMLLDAGQRKQGVNVYAGWA